MNLVQALQTQLRDRVEPTGLLERDLLPDGLIRYGIRRLVSRRLAAEGREDIGVQQQRLRELIDALRSSPVAIETDTANDQHYALPTGFFQQVLGPQLKYSCCYFPQAGSTLAQAEQAMLELTMQRAELRDGEDILELGCGWGSLTLAMAARLPRSRVTAVSNSPTQREHIEREVARRGHDNVRVLTRDMNALDFPADERFDRVVSVEMFEHMRNYEVLLRRISRWMRPEATLFVHIFAHRRFAYPFEVRDGSDWMARYFFTGGLMPSADLLLYFQRDVHLVHKWQVPGHHYQRTANAWLANMDHARPRIMPLFREVYGPDQALRWWVYWRVFFMACAELFGYRAGSEWLVGHYLFARS